jgi:hypothetical protein
VVAWALGANSDAAAAPDNIIIQPAATVFGRDSRLPPGIPTSKRSSPSRSAKRSANRSQGFTTPRRTGPGGALSA